MKKVLALVLAFVMLFALAACGGTADKGQGDEKGDIDMSKYPADINAWSGQNFVDYFTEAGVFDESRPESEIWTQPHQMYWDATPVSEAVGFWDNDNSIIIYILKEELADSDKATYDEWMGLFKQKKAPKDYMIEVSHIVGNVAFEYETSVTDDALYEKMDAAYKYLVEKLGVTPEL